MAAAILLALLYVEPSSKNHDNSSEKRLLFKSEIKHTTIRDLSSSASPTKVSSSMR